MLLKLECARKSPSDLDKIRIVTLEVWDLRFCISCLEDGILKLPSWAASKSLLEVDRSSPRHTDAESANLQEPQVILTCVRKSERH